MISTNLKDIAALIIGCVHYTCIINGFSKSETLNLLRKDDLSRKSGTL